MPFTFHVASEFCVVGTNSELSDFDNPRGEIVRELFFMVAEDERGAQYRVPGMFEESEFEAEVAFEFFAPDLSEWVYFRCVYGSSAYVENSCEEEQVYLEREAA